MRDRKQRRADRRDDRLERLNRRYVDGASRSSREEERGHHRRAARENARVERAGRKMDRLQGGRSCVVTATLVAATLVEVLHVRGAA